MTWRDTLTRSMPSWDALRQFRTRAAETVLVLLGLAVVCWVVFRPFRQDDALLHVAYGASREYFAALESALPVESDGLGGASLSSSHAGSFRQLEAVARGLTADTVCLATPIELDRLAWSGLVARDWREDWPHRASPFFSTIVFVVPAGNPKAIVEWSDLERPDVMLAAPSPRVSGAGVYAFLALLQDLEERHQGDPHAVRQGATEVYRRARLLDLGAQQALQVFTRASAGDIFLTWESEGLRLSRTAAGKHFEAVHPPRSILAEPVVALLTPHLEARGSEPGARAFLRFLFAPEGQRIAAEHGLRPRHTDDGDRFPPIELISVEAVFGSWDEAWARHLGSEGTFTWIERVRAARAGGIE